MFRFRARRALTAWIATFALLVSVLAPAASQAMSAFADDEQQWVEVCTPAGMQWLAVNSGDAGGDDDNAGMASCPYCYAHAGSFALPPPTAPTVLALPRTSAEQPRLFLIAPRPLFAWAASHPRAPPLNA